MKLDDKTKKSVDAKRKMLEAEAELLEEVIEDAVHWDRPRSIVVSLNRIRSLVN